LGVPNKVEQSTSQNRIDGEGFNMVPGRVWPGYGLGGVFGGKAMLAGSLPEGVQLRART